MDNDFSITHRDNRAGGCAVRVHQQRRIRREHSLRKVVEGHVAVILLEAGANHLLRFREEDKLLARNLCRHALGDIIDRRAETAGGNDDIRAAERKAVGVLQALRIITHDGLVLLRDAQRGQAAREELRVGVEDLPHQEFRADT